jgi:hypothetical protein
MAKTAILTLKILADAKDAQKGLDETATSASKLQDGVGKAAVPAAAALAGLAAAGISAAKAAAEDQKSAGLLAQTLRNTTGASDASIAATEKWISKTSKAAAVADDELRPALGTLVRATGDTEESQKAMGVALDVSAATGKDVESVSNALAKAYAGNTASLGKLVPGMDKAVLASGDMDAIMGELARTTGGSAAEAAGSAAGQWKGFQIQMGEAQEAIGGALLPAMTKLGSSLAGVAGWVQENTTLFLVIGGVIGAVAAAILILNVAFKAYAVITKAISAATKVWAAVQWLLNSAILANPITWIVIAIVALIAVIVLIATKTTWFQDLWATVWGAITRFAEAAWAAILSAANAAIEWIVGVWQTLQAGVQAVWDWIVNAVSVALAFVGTVISTYIAIYVAIWDAIRAGVAAVWDWIVSAIKAALRFIVDAVKFYIGLYVAAFEGIKDAVGAVWEWLKDAARTALDAILKPVNAVRDAFDRVVDAIRSVIEWLAKIKIPDVLGSIGDAIGGLFSAPSAAAARSTGTGFAVAGVGARAFSSGAPTLSASSMSGTPTIVIQGALDPVAVARQVRQILTTDERRRGGVVIA